MAPCGGSMSQNLLLQATETQLVFGLSSIGNVMARINGSPDSFRHGWTQGLSVIRPWFCSFLIWLCFLHHWLHSQQAFLQADIIPQLWSESLSLILVPSGLPKQTQFAQLGLHALSWNSGDGGKVSFFWNKSGELMHQLGTLRFDCPIEDFPELTLTLKPLV